MASEEDGWEALDGASPEDVISEFDDRSDEHKSSGYASGTAGGSPKGSSGPPSHNPPPSDDLIPTGIEAVEEVDEEEEDEEVAVGGEGRDGAIVTPPPPPPHKPLPPTSQEPVPPPSPKASDLPSPPVVALQPPEMGDVHAVKSFPTSDPLQEMEDMPLSPQQDSAYALGGGPPAVSVEGGMSREHVPSKDEPILESPKARNWGWGWGAMAGAFKDVSAGITKDVQELKESFRAAIRVDSDEENEDLGEDGVQTNLLRTHTHTSDATSDPQLQPSADELKRLEVLGRLERTAGRRNAAGGLEDGLKAIDDQMEQLATGLWGLVGKAAGGVGTLAKKVEAATKEVASEVAVEFKDTLQDVRSLHAVKLASSGIAAVIATAERGLENAIQVLDGTQDSLAARGPDATFEQCFHDEGGQAALDEAEELGNECSRICNRGRRALTEDRRSELDSQVAAFAPLFDLSGPLVGTREGGKGTIPLADSYGFVEKLRMQSIDHAFALSAAAVDMGRLQQEDQPDNLALEDEGPFEEEPSKATAALNALRGEAVQCLAAISSAGVKYLLELGNSVGAPLLTGAADPAFDWPQTAEARATLLRFSAQQLEDDVRAVSAAFTKALGEAGESLRVAGDGSDAGKEVEVELQDLAAEVEDNAAMAVQRLREAFRALMYIILALILHESGETPSAREEDEDEDEDEDDYFGWADDQAADGDEDDEEQ